MPFHPFVPVATLLCLLLLACDGGAPPEPLAAVPTPATERLDKLGAEHIARITTRLAALPQTLPRDPAKRAEPAEVFGEIGLDFHAYGFAEAARACYANAAMLAPEDWRWPYLSGVLLLRAGDNQRAETALTRAAALYQADRDAGPSPPGPDSTNPTPSAPDAPPKSDLQQLALQWRLGQAALQRGDIETAVARFRRLTEQHPEAHRAWLSLGKAELAAGRAEAAVAALGHAARLAPGRAAIRYQQGLAYRALGDRERAEPLLKADRRGMALVDIADPLLADLALRKRSPAALIQTGTAYLSAGRCRRAAELYRAALELDPEATHAHVNLASCLVRLGRASEARTHLERALALDPDLANAHIGLAGLDKRNGRADAALGHLRSAETLDPDNTQMLADLGHLLAERGDAAGAARRFEALLAKEPSNERGLLGRARVLDLEGRRSAALAALERAAELRPDSPTIERALRSYRRTTSTAAPKSH